MCARCLSIANFLLISQSPPIPHRQPTCGPAASSLQEAWADALAAMHERGLMSCQQQAMYCEGPRLVCSSAFDSGCKYAKGVGGEEGRGDTLGSVKLFHLRVLRSWAVDLCRAVHPVAGAARRRENNSHQGVGTPAGLGLQQEGCHCGHIQ